MIIRLIISLLLLIAVARPSVASIITENSGKQEQLPDWSILEASLLNSTLYGPVIESVYEQCSTYDNATARSGALSGTCMESFQCGYQFCDPHNYEHNLPRYTLDVRSEIDLVKAIEFALNYSIPLSVKTTGYSLQGSSTVRDSLLIWMHNFPKDDEIKVNYSGENFRI